jgi:putative phage-type endonuclease
MTIIPATDRADWLAARRAGIGSSDAAAVLGVCPYRTAFQVWAEKRGLMPPPVETPAMRRGLLLEGHILDEAERLLECGTLCRQVFVAHPDRPWQLATLDGLTADGTLIVEAKTVGYRQAHLWGEPWTDEVPDAYLVQVQHQLAVTGIGRAAVVALIGGSDLNVYHVERDDRLIGQLVDLEAAFWAGVRDGVEPPVTDPADAEILAFLHPITDAAIDLPPDVAELVDAYQDTGRTIRALEVSRGLARAQLLAALGDAGRGTLPDGRAVVRRLVKRAGYVVDPSEFQTLTVKETRQ